LHIKKIKHTLATVMKGNDKFWMFWEHNYNPITMWRKDEKLTNDQQHIRGRRLNRTKDI